MVSRLATERKIREFMIKKHLEGKSVSKVSKEVSFRSQPPEPSYKNTKKTDSINVTGKRNGRPRTITDRN